MNIPEQIQAYIASQPEAKKTEMETLHQLILQVAPKSTLWFEDGKDSSGKIVSNPNIGYGTQTMHYANGKTRAFFKVGISANTTGISVYIMGIDDKKYLAETFGTTIGKAKVTGYCINFKTLKDINLEVLEDIIKFGLENR